MCRAVEEYANGRKSEWIAEGEARGKLKTVKNMIENGLDLDTALKYADLDKETYNKYAERMQ